MPAHPREQDFETEIAYWRDRVSSLQVLVGELLAKNQVRITLLPVDPPRF